MAERADVILSRMGLAKSRTHAARLIKDGLARWDGKPIIKPSQLIEEDSAISVDDGGCPFVSRGGLKLEKALDAFEIDVNGVVALDVGASTGGFTDCLLSRGAKKVYAVDVGTGQLDEGLKNDCRVVSIEKTNARSINKSLFDEEIDIAVMDVSFISQSLIYPALSEVLPVGGILVALIKPQFELGRQALNRHGIVKNPEKQFPILKNKLEAAAEACGMKLLSTVTSPITGGDGNKEYLAMLVKG